MSHIEGLPTRIIDKIDVGDCWEWIGAKTTSGYGSTWWEGKTDYPHRIFYEVLVEEIPEGMEIHHHCENRACVNPDHFEVVTHAQNMKYMGFKGNQHPREGKTHCKNGHELSGENLYLHNGNRYCRTCRRANWRRWHERQKS